MNIIIIQSCTNTCPYCFQVGERGVGKDQMSVGDAIQFSSWLIKAKPGSLSIIGGEPFLHPDLSKIIQIFRKACPYIPSNAFVVFSGGIIQHNTLDPIHPEDVSLLFNINEPRDYRSKAIFNGVLRIIEKAIRRGFEVNIGFNIWRTDFDPMFMPKLAYEFGRNSFRWTVANPRCDFLSNVVYPKHFSSLRPICQEMLDYSANLGISAYLDCPLPLCFFDEANWGKIALNHPHTFSLLGSHCEPAIDITPDLCVLRCFSMGGGDKIPLFQFSSISDIKKYFKHKIDDQYAHYGIYSDCVSCTFFKLNKCFGGCLASRKGIGSSMTKPLPLADRLYSLLESNNMNEAISEFEAASKKERTPLATYLASIAASSYMRWDEAFRYASLAYQMAADNNLKKKILTLLESIPCIFAGGNGE